MFPAACGLRVTPAGKRWLGRQLAVALAPGAPCLGRAPTLPGNVQATPTRMFLHVCSAGDSLQPRPVCTVLCYCWQNTLGTHLEPGPRGPNWHFLPGEP